MCRDLGQARAWLGGQGARVLALRSACLPVLADAIRREVPVDLVLWDPCLSGGQMLARWRSQHHVQLTAAGRYLRAGRAPVDEDELLGFDVATELSAALAALEFRTTALPRGSRVTLVTWPDAEDGLDDFAAAQRAAGVELERVVLRASDRPDWEDAPRFESQVFPRRGVAAVAALIQEMSR